MGYTVTLDIKSSDFPELGNPAYPADYNSVKGSLPKENRTKVKDSFESYKRGSYKVTDKIKNSVVLNSGKNAFNYNEMCFQFNYQEGTPKTYKFLGMDIDENYNAVILLGDGYTIVDTMFDREKIKSFSLSDNYSSRFSKDVESLVDLAIDDRLTANVVRTLSTYLKTGAIYDMAKVDGSNGMISIADIDSETKTIRLLDLDPLVQVIKDKIYGNNSNVGGQEFKFKSVLLNIVNKAKSEDFKLKAEDSSRLASDTDLNTTIVSGIISKIFRYWESVVKKYNDINIVVSEIDLWQNLGRESLGDIEFNRRMKKSFDIVNDDGTVENRIISFAGVAKDDGILDANLFRSSVAIQIENLSSILNGVSYRDVSLKDLLLGNIDTTTFSNPYELSVDEIQAVSSYDSLKFVDEDANSCIQSYNLDDEEDRSLFIKSAIKSYDRNFRAFKPKDDYDVSQAFSDLIEKGVTFSDKIVSKSVSTDQDIDKYVVTTSVAAIDRDAAKKSLIKVGKLLNKSLDSVYELFGAVPTSVNP